MSTDRELLELAAKAAGYLISSSPIGNCLIAEPGRGQRVWNPLLLDGDAFRLAVKLRMLVEVDHYHGMADGIVEEIRDEPLDATRRAIVRAAAEIGRSMP